MAKVLRKLVDRWVGRKAKCEACKTEFKIEKDDEVLQKRKKEISRGPRQDDEAEEVYRMIVMKCPECEKEVVLAKRKI